MSEITSRVYQPNAAMCCEACVFGRGEHAEWCTAPCNHRWKTQRLGGPPDVADSYEMVTFCELCGEEPRDT
jgi:hypothetical protein